ncbi:MAG: hypothetical protein ACLUKN_13700 [Bacilli bacterium]
MFEAAWTASECDKADEKNTQMVESKNPFIRYWGSVGLLNLNWLMLMPNFKTMSDSAIITGLWRI